MEISQSQNDPVVKISHKPNLWRETAILAQMVMELCWIVPWYRSLTRATYSTEAWRVFSILLGILLGMHWLARGLNWLKLRIDIRRGAIILGNIVSVLLGLRFLLYYSDDIGFLDLLQRPIAAFNDVLVAIPDEFLIILVVLFVGYRGITIASQTSSPGEMFGRFQVGVGLLVLFMLLNTLLTGESPGLFVPMFIFSGLMAVGAARMATLSRMRGGRENPFHRSWLAAIAATAMVAVGVATLLGGVGNSKLFEAIMRGIGLLLGALVGIILVLMTPIFLLMIYTAAWLSEQFPMNEALPQLLENLQLALGAVRDLASQLFEAVARFMPNIQVSKGVILWGSLIGLAGLALVFLTLRWVLYQKENSDEEEFESLWKRGQYLLALRALLAKRLRNLADSRKNRLQRNTSARRRAAARIRQIYADLIDLAETLKLHKQEAQTPREFLPLLEKRFAGREDEVRRITEAYLRVRYGELPESAEEMDVLEADWQAVQAKGEEINKKPA